MTAPDRHQRGPDRAPAARPAGGSDPVADAIQAAVEGAGIGPSAHRPSRDGLPPVHPDATFLPGAGRLTAAEAAEITVAVAVAAGLRQAALPPLPAARRESLRGELGCIEAAIGGELAGPRLSSAAWRGIGIAGVLAALGAGLAGLAMRPEPALDSRAPGRPAAPTAIQRGGWPSLAGVTTVVAPLDRGPAAHGLIVGRAAGPPAGARAQGAGATRGPVAPGLAAVSTGAASSSGPSTAGATSTALPYPATAEAASPGGGDHDDRRRQQPAPTATATAATVAIPSPTAASAATPTAAVGGGPDTPTPTEPPAAASGIAGGVVDARGTPLEAALVKAESVDGAGRVVWTRSAADGSYRIDVPPGAYRVSAELDGHATRWYAGRTRPEDADPVVVADGRLTPGIDFELPASGLPGQGALP